MAQMMAQLILAALLIYSKSAKPSPLFTEDRYTGELAEEPSQGLQSETDGKEQQITELPFYCDTESLIIDVSPTQYPLLYLLRDDGTRFYISQLLKECSHVELQSASLLRIFYRGCSLLDWLGQEKQYTVKLGSSHLNEDTVQTQTCPSAQSGPVQLPDVKCEGATMTVSLAAKELRVARFIELDASSLQEKIMIEGDGLTQWTDGEKLVVQVENPMMEDQYMLLLQFTDISEKLKMVKVFCPQHHAKLQRGTQTKNINKHSDTHHGLEASEYTGFPFIQWAMPVFMSEQFTPSPTLIISDSLPDTTLTSVSTAEIITSTGTIIRTTPESIPKNTAAGTTKPESNSEAGHQLGPILTNTESVLETTTAVTSTESSMTSGAMSTADAITKATESTTEPETLSSKNNEPYTTSVEMKTPPEETHATANTTPVNSTTTTPNSTTSLTTAHEETKTTALYSYTEANTWRTTPTNTTDAETNPTAWTSVVSTLGTASYPAEARTWTTTSPPTAASPIAPTAPDVDYVGTALKTSTVERNTPAAATAANYSVSTTTGFQNISTELSTSAWGPSTMASNTTESPGSFTTLTTSGVNILATATQMTLTEATSAFTPLKTFALPETTTSVDSALTVSNFTAASSANPAITLIRSTSANVLNNEVTTGTTQTETSELLTEQHTAVQTAASVIEAPPVVEQSTPSGESAVAATPMADTSPAVETETVSTTEPTISSTTAAPFTPTSLPGITAEAKSSSTPAMLVTATIISVSTAVKTKGASTTQPDGIHTGPAVSDCIPETTTPEAEAAVSKRQTSAAASITRQATVFSSGITSTVTTTSEISSTAIKNTPVQIPEKGTLVAENISIDANSPNTATASDSKLVLTMSPETPAEEDAPTSSTTEAPLLNSPTTATAAGPSPPANIWTADLQTLLAAPFPPAAIKLSGSTTDPVYELFNNETATVQTSRNEQQAVQYPHDTPAAATAANYSVSTTTGFQNISTELSTSAWGPSTMASNTTESPGSFTTLTTSGVNILATATQMTLTEATSAFTPLKTFALPETTTSVDSALTVSNFTAASSANPAITLIRSTSANVLNNEVTTGTTQTETSELLTEQHTAVQTAASVIEAPPVVEQRTPSSEDALASSTTEALLLNSPTTATAAGPSPPANIWTADLQTLLAAPAPPAAIELSGSTTAAPDPVYELCNNETATVQTSRNEQQAVQYPHDIWGSSHTTTTTP